MDSHEFGEVYAGYVARLRRCLGRALELAERLAVEVSGGHGQINSHC